MSRSCVTKPVQMFTTSHLKCSPSQPRVEVPAAARRSEDAGREKGGGSGGGRWGEDEAPNEFACPITMDVMKDPVRCLQGI